MSVNECKNHILKLCDTSIIGNLTEEDALFPDLKGEKSLSNLCACVRVHALDWVQLLST